MSSDDKTLQETIGEVIGQQETANENNQSFETKEGISANAATGETDSGGTPDNVAGIDISDVPEQDRPRIIKALKEKFDIADKGIQKKFQEVAPLKKALDDLKNIGYTPEQAWEVLRKSKETPTQTASDSKTAIKKLDKLISEAPYEQKEQLTNFRDIILEETNVSALMKKVENLERALGYVSATAQTSKVKEINEELNSLSSRFGKDFIDKHRDTIVDVALKNPGVALTRIIKVETPDDEYEQAILSRGKKILTTEKKNAITSSGSGVTSSVEKIDSKKPLNQIMMEAIKRKR